MRRCLRLHWCNGMDWARGIVRQRWADADSILSILLPLAVASPRDTDPQNQVEGEQAVIADVANFVSTAFPHFTGPSRRGPQTRAGRKKLRTGRVSTRVLGDQLGTGCSPTLIAMHVCTYTLGKRRRLQSGHRIHSAHTDSSAAPWPPGGSCLSSLPLTCVFSLPSALSLPPASSPKPAA